MASKYAVDEIPQTIDFSSSFSGGGSALGGDWLSTLVEGASKFFGSEDFLGSVMSGLSTAFGQQSANKSSKKDRDLKRELVREQGDETRKTALYAAQLQDHYNQLNRYRKAQGASNYTAYSRANAQPGGALGTMLNYNSPHQISNPGNAPTPAPLFETRKGASWNFTDKPLYGYDANGNLVANPPTTKKGP